MHTGTAPITDMHFVRPSLPIGMVVQGLPEALSGALRAVMRASF